MVAVELDGNYIDGEPIQSRKAKSLTKAYQAIFQRWKATGVICPNWHILDNEAPKELKQAIRENKCRVELTPADQHRRNAAERAIQTFKGHFISVLAGVDNNFPINQWDELLTTNDSYLEFTPAIERGSQHLCMGVSSRQFRL